MSSDADYEAFLLRSQKDYSVGYEGSNHAPAAGTISIQVESDPHPAIKALGERFYISDVDEPFEGISFKWRKESLPTADEFSDLTGSGSGSDIEVLEPNDWDRRDTYKDVKDAVSAACGEGAADLKVYRIGDGVRATYYVVSLDEKSGKVVGVRVKAVES
ncbi:hypothetical protein K440DRAFT_594668 [Wilcoxina mikolae CBS 423.85]|nr:hypothetical protein K440DRAFT_594668 [Wilcoxina mikolae CBS 423.85]